MGDRLAWLCRTTAASARPASPAALPPFPCLQGHNGDSDKWVTDVLVRQEWVKVEGWVLPELPPLITDILISLDDK